ncbi:MAG: fructose-1,6-bisphosphatase [Deltaproteobacteria bacterium]|nr:fructose-1,6-bisphosphatase [Deltaproteobacteria bacterium]
MSGGISDYTQYIVDLRRHMWLSGVPTELRRLIWQVATTGKYISAKIQESNRKLAGLQNIYHEEQLALDRSSDEILVAQLANTGLVREYLSEEREAPIKLGTGTEKYIITADPLDGSSLVETNLTIGTIIGIHKKEPLGSTGRKTLCGALYILYGPLITMVYSAGKGSHEFVLNREGEYVLSQANIQLKEKGSIYSLGGLRKDWLSGHAAFANSLEEQGYKLRYSGGLVPDLNQILIKQGGIFSYPQLRSNPRGKLRLLFELQPMAFLFEGAGGAATNGEKDILDIKVDHLDQCAPIYIGSKHEVALAKQHTARGKA